MSSQAWLNSYAFITPLSVSPKDEFYTENYTTLLLGFDVSCPAPHDDLLEATDDLLEASCEAIQATTNT